MSGHIRLAQWWRETDAGIVSRPASEEAIASLCARYDLDLPGDFRLYLKTAIPADDDTWDEESGTWWPMERIKNVPDEYPHSISPILPNQGKKLLFFVDHLIWCWAWAISCEKGPTFGKVALIRGDRDCFVADSFTEFVDRYIDDWKSVSYPWAKR